jgi:hypothetical protein
MVDSLVGWFAGVLLVFGWSVGWLLFLLLWLIRWLVGLLVSCWFLVGRLVAFPVAFAPVWLPGNIINGSSVVKFKLDYLAFHPTNT